MAALPRAGMRRCCRRRWARPRAGISKAALLYGDVIGRELRAQGFNMSIGGGVDLTREPRNGRNFEYAGEDPLLAGTMVGNLIKGVQSEQVMGDIKHYAMNDQETGRNVVNVRAGPQGDARDRPAGLSRSRSGLRSPSAVMCCYNKVNGDYACENDYLLNQVLKKDWELQGFRGVGLGGNAQHGEGGAGRAGPGAAGRPVLRARR